jgi:hypothetical protein
MFARKLDSCTLNTQRLSIHPCLQLSLGTLARNGALNQTVRVGLWRIDFRVLSCVLQTVMPAEINLKVVFVRKRVIDRVHSRNRSQNLIAHFVHRILHARAVVICEGLERNFPCLLPRLIEILGPEMDFLQAGECLPKPATLNFCAEDAVPGLWQDGVVALVVTVKSRARALQHEELVDAGLDGDTAASFLVSCYHFNFADLFAITVEAVRMRLAVNDDASPAVLDNLDMCNMDV